MIPIKNFEDYMITDKGRVYSTKRKGQFLKPFEDKDGYLCVNLRYKNNRKVCKIHRLVAEHFIPTTNINLTVDHIDCDKKNNTVVNLRWLTNEDNASRVRVIKLPRGVYHNGNGFIGQCNKYGRKIWSKTFSTPYEASIWYKQQKEVLWI